MRARELRFWHDLRNQVEGWDGEGTEMPELGRRAIPAAPALFRCLVDMAEDKDLPFDLHRPILFGVVYFMDGFDLIPEIEHGPAGLIDDVVLAAHVLETVADRVGEDMVRRHWRGLGDPLDLVRELTTNAEALVGAGRWRILQAEADS